ncbi:hypothetical protein BDP27DRAFT_1206321 [Rhodocollybia butyracea]|uniref:F-box domain-containing protein n=1 Tax=Rhodocollybia butyracea TaxID=206335 RepID=A0A9P5UGT7_9AGAR|nr:hypothetical protein BDP27DRAFT_1206321 [Rhodocollybia butyracea]
MAVFSLDIPLELLPEIFYHIRYPQDLCKLCQVNKTFHHFATPLLYERIYIFSWHKHGKLNALQVIRLFKNLSQYPHVAQFVRKLEIRDFPKAFSSDDDVDILQKVTEGLRNCTNLRSCTWTRDGSLSSEILKALQSSQTLQELEINGHDQGNYDSQLLLQFTRLRKISLVMPSLTVISVLQPWLQITGKTLRSLTIICKSSPILNNAKLELLAPYLSEVEHLHLAGCSKITHEGIRAVLCANDRGLLSLGLEGLSPQFDMLQFRLDCTRMNAFHRLRSITLTVNHQTSLDIWANEVAALLPKTVPLETFQIYSSGAFIESQPGTERLWADLVTAHKHRLVRFSVHRILLSLSAIEDICRRCTKLEQLFIVIEQSSVNNLSRCLPLVSNLRTLHVNFPLEASQLENATPVLPESDALTIVERCVSIQQFGCNTRVWQVERDVLFDETSSPIGIKRRLTRYQGLDIPEAFMVVRT